LATLVLSPQRGRYSYSYSYSLLLDYLDHVRYFDHHGWFVRESQSREKTKTAIEYEYRSAEYEYEYDENPLLRSYSYSYSYSLLLDYLDHVRYFDHHGWFVRESQSREKTKTAIEYEYRSAEYEYEYDENPLLRSYSPLIKRPDDVEQRGHNSPSWKEPTDSWKSQNSIAGFNSNYSV